MNDIKFNCPQCGQHLSVDATVAGVTVACPKCGQTIMVPQLARTPTNDPVPIRRNWTLLAAAIAVVVLLAGGAMVWQMGRHSAAQIAGAPAPAPGGSKPVTSAAAPFPNASENSAPAIPAALDGAMRSLVLYFNFDSQPVGARVPDLSGHGNEGRAVNVQWVADGHRGGSIRFGKDDSYITVLNNASLNPPRFTLAAWIKTSYSDRVWRRIFDKGTGIDYDLTMGGDVKGNQRFRGWVALEVGKTWAPSQVRVTDGRWHQVVGTFDGEMARTYVDGMPVGRPGRWKGTPTPVMWNLTIGANRSNPDAALGEVGASFNGLMDDVMMFNRALSPREVQALYDSQRTAADRPVARKQPAPDAPAQLKARRISALSGALRVFQNRDPETANLVSNILASLNQPGGLTTNELARDMERMRSRVRELVRRGDMESAAALNHAQIMTFYSYDFPSQPGHPNQKSGGTPGPGGLVLYLPFDKPDTNGVVHDESGAGNDGRVFGAQWVPDGKFGGAYRFSISDFDDRIVIPNSDSLDAEDLTVAAWIKAPADTGFFERILDKDFHHGFALSLSGDWQNQRDRGRLLWETGNGTVTSGRRPDDNQWHHVAATYDGHFVRCYVDGVETANRAIRQGPLNKSGWDLCIGNSVVDYGWGELMAFNGLIDEVRVYNRALSPAEISTLATATHAGADILGAPARGGTDATARLKKLKQLYQQGLINKQVYDQEMKEILDSL